MVKKSVLVVQAKDTGRFLLKKRDDVWGFAAQHDFDPEVSILFNLIKQANVAMGLAEDSDDFCLDYVDNIGKVQVFHALVESELISDPDAEWCHLFTFPENFDPIFDKLFQDNAFLAKIVQPEI
jgi:hypothetical protein